MNRPLLNVDLGERGVEHPVDLALLDHADLANVACGGHGCACGRPRRHDPCGHRAQGRRRRPEGEPAPAQRGARTAACFAAAEAQ